MTQMLLLAFRVGFVVAIVTITWLALTSSAVAQSLAWWDKGNHFIAFFVLSFLLDHAAPDDAVWWRGNNPLKWSGLLAYGVGIECMQWYSGERQFELLDAAADLVGIVAYIAIRPLTVRVELLADLRIKRS